MCKPVSVLIYLNMNYAHMVAQINMNSYPHYVENCFSTSAIRPVTANSEYCIWTSSTALQTHEREKVQVITKKMI